MQVIYLMLPAAYFIAGILPILFWNRRTRVSSNIYLLGWLSWFCAVSVKFFIATIQNLNWPIFYTFLFLRKFKFLMATDYGSFAGSRLCGCP